MITETETPSGSAIFALFARLKTLVPSCQLTDDQLLAIVNNQNSSPKQKLLAAIFDFIGITSVNTLLEQRKSEKRLEMKRNLPMYDRKQNDFAFDGVFSVHVAKELDVS
jgi:hypothetical protein